MVGETSLAARVVVRTALRILLVHPRRIVGAGIVVFGTTAVIDVAVAEINDRADSAHPLLVVLVLMGTSLGMVGATFYAGLLDRIVAEEARGDERHSLGQVLRTLPYGRLLAADVLLTVGALVCSLALVVPGIVFYTYFSLVGPVINIEDHGVLAAFRRSGRLVRGHFRVVLLLVTIPILVEEQVLHTVEVLVHDAPTVGVFAFNAVIGTVVGSVVGLIAVTLAHRLTLLTPMPEPIPLGSGTP